MIKKYTLATFILVCSMAHVIKPMDENNKRKEQTSEQEQQPTIATTGLVQQNPQFTMPTMMAQVPQISQTAPAATSSAASESHSTMPSSSVCSSSSSAVAAGQSIPVQPRDISDSNAMHLSMSSGFRPKNNPQSPHVSTPAIASASSSSLSAAVSASQASNADLNARNRWGIIKLHNAAKRNNVNEVINLLVHGVDINAISDHGSTPLINAVNFGALDVVRVLLTGRACINAKNNTTGFTALHIAAQENHTAIAQLLIAGNLTERADLNATTNAGATPLMIATLYGALDVVRLLLTNGAQINAKNKYGQTALHYAAQKNNAPIAQLLIEQTLTERADINATNIDDETPLLFAAFHGALDVVRLLLTKGADVRRLNRFNATAYDAVLLALQKLGQPQASENQTITNHRNNLNAIKTLFIQYHANITGKQILAERQQASSASASSSSAATPTAQAVIAPVASYSSGSSSSVTAATAPATGSVTSTSAVSSSSSSSSAAAPIGDIWTTLPQLIIDEVCVKTVREFGKTAQADLLETIKNKLKNLFALPETLITRDVLINNVLTMLKRHLLDLIDNPDIDDFTSNLENTLRTLLRRNDIKAQLEIILKLKAAAGYVLLKKKHDDQDGAAGATALPKKFVEKMQQIFSRAKQPEASWWNTASIKNIGTQALLNFGTHAVLGKIRHGMSLKSLATAAAQ